MISHPELWAFSANWYRLLDIHAPLDSYRSLLTKDVQLVFPESTVDGFDGYSGWYNNVIKIFFDEQHTLKVADIINQNDSVCEAHVVVNWHASIWNAPEARSIRLMMDADQTWQMRRQGDGSLAISKYVVNYMSYETGSCKL
jgi:hypothetical protein